MSQNKPRRFFNQEQNTNRQFETNENTAYKKPNTYKPRKFNPNYVSDSMMKIMERVPEEYRDRLWNMEMERQQKARERIDADPEAKLKNKSKYGLNVKNKLKYDWKKMLDKLIRQDELKKQNGGILPPKPVYKPKIVVDLTDKTVISPNQTNKQEKKIKPRVYKKTGLPLPPPKPKKIWIRGIPMKLEGILIPEGGKPEPKGITVQEKGLKNPIFIKNVEDPLTGKIVEEILFYKIMKPTQFKEYRDKWEMAWQYFRDRHKHSIQETYDKYKNCLLRIVYKNDPTVFFIDNRNQEDKERWLKFVNDPNYTEQRYGEKSLPDNWGKPKLPTLNPPPKKGEVKRLKMMKRILAKGEPIDNNIINEIKLILTKVPFDDFDIDLALQKKQLHKDDVPKLKHIVATIKPDPTLLDDCLPDDDDIIIEESSIDEDDEDLEDEDLDDDDLEEELIEMNKN
jgi:hypothetical protein